MLKTIIFDCDGVISETEISRFRHLKKLAEEKGHKGLDEKEHLRFLVGRRSKELLQQVFGENISEQVIEEIVNKRRQDWKDSPEKFISEMKGIKAVCEELGNKYDLAVASTAPRQTVEATLKHLGLEKSFKLVLTGSDVKNHKPDPEVYLKMLRRLGIESEECIAIEDSETGIAAAKKAGIKVVALRNELYEEYGYSPDLSKADIIIDELKDLLKMVW